MKSSMSSAGNIRSMKFSNLLFQIEFEDFSEMMEDLGLPISYHWAAPPQLIKCQRFLWFYGPIHHFNDPQLISRFPQGIYQNVQVDLGKPNVNEENHRH